VVCHAKQRDAAAARFYADAFAHDARLADDRATSNRYNAACCAALAGCGRGGDADQLDEKERARLRKQALDWLRADLAARARLAAGDKRGDRAAVRQTLQHWQEDADLVQEGRQLSSRAPSGG
jgi:hypothetical protein